MDKEPDLMVCILWRVHRRTVEARAFYAPRSSIHTADATLTGGRAAPTM